jgi:hypothetical protein
MCYLICGHWLYCLLCISVLLSYLEWNASWYTSMSQHPGAAAAVCSAWLGHYQWTGTNSYFYWPLSQGSRPHTTAPYTYYIAPHCTWYINWVLQHASIIGLTSARQHTSLDPVDPAAQLANCSSFINAARNTQQRFCVQLWQCNVEGIVLTTVHLRDQQIRSQDQVSTRRYSTR